MTYDENKKKGYVIRYRSIYDWYLNNESLDIYALAIYDYLIAFARKEPTNYKGVSLKVGQLIRSHAQIAKALKISRRTVIRKIAALKDDGAIDIQPVMIGSINANIITVKNFKKYQTVNDDEPKKEKVIEADASDINLDEMLQKLD